MSKLERLNARVAKLLTEAVQEVLEVVKETVSEYQEKTARTLRENESLKRRLHELQHKITKQSTPVLPASGPLPEQTQDTGSQEQELSLAHRLNSGIILTEQKPASGHTPDHDLKQEYKKRESCSVNELLAECTSAQPSAEHNEAQAEEGTCIDTHVMTHKEPMTVQTSHIVNRDTSSVSSNSAHTSQSSSPLGVNPTAIKKEPEPTDCTISELPALQEQYTECVDLSCNSSRHNFPETVIPQVSGEPYGLVFVHSNHSIARRHGFAKANRAAFDVRKIRREHFRGEDSHLCVICGKSFSRVGNLRIHQRCHTGEKPYGCIQCGRRFSQAGDLKKHKRVHTGEKPYYCNQCGKSFSRGENLKRHQKIHIGETLQLQQAWREQQL